MSKDEKGLAVSMIVNGSPSRDFHYFLPLRYLFLSLILLLLFIVLVVYPYILVSFSVFTNSKKIILENTQIEIQAT